MREDADADEIAEKNIRSFRDPKSNKKEMNYLDFFRPNGWFVASAWFKHRLCTVCKFDSSRQEKFDVDHVITYQKTHNCTENFRVAKCGVFSNHSGILLRLGTR